MVTNIEEKIIKKKFAAFGKVKVKTNMTYTAL